MDVPILECRFLSLAVPLTSVVYVNENWGAGCRDEEREDALAPI